MKYLMCNLKSNKTLKEILIYKKKLESINHSNKEFILFPSSIYLGLFYDTNYKIGSQIISEHESGSYTGEILANQLASLRVSYVLINHCEIRETLNSCLLKIKNATKNQIKVVYCIGKETNGYEIEKLKGQIKSIFDQLIRTEMENIIIAYEPCWAINKEDVINASALKNIIKKLKQYINCEYDIKVDFVYGGSINIENFDKLVKIDNLDGYLLGNCANKPENILKIAVKF